MGFCRISAGSTLGGVPPRTKDQPAEGRTRRFVQIQHTPKPEPGLTHKSFCEFLCPTSRCASTLHPSQASPPTHPPPSSLA